MKQYFKRKSIKDLLSQAESSKDLERSLNGWQLILLGIGAIIGAGIFVLTGEAASQHAGPAIILSFAISGAACVCAGLCYAELASTIPVSGSAYTYIYATLGELPACIMSGLMLLGSFPIIASVAGGWSGYTLSFLADFGIIIPARLTAVTGQMVTLADGTEAPALFDLPALFIVLSLSTLLCFGAQTSAWVNSVIVFIKMSVLIAFVILGAFSVDPSNWVPFIPENTGEFGKFGFSGVIAGASIVFLAYNGFDSVATAAQETKNPQRDLPIGILGSLLVCTIAYVLVSAVLTGIVPYNEFKGAQPIALAVDRMNMPWFSFAVKVCAISGLTSVILVMLYGLARILFTIAKDGLLPDVLTICHKKYKTPYISTMIAGSVISVIGATVPLDTLVKLSNFGVLCSFAITCFAALYLRYTQPNIERAFKCPMMPWIPLLGIILLIQIIAGLPIETYIEAACWMVFVLLLYFLYGRSNSKLQNCA
ncbi:amino acid permease [Candidatus Lariskella endosymbiont of Epinotia ramella]|uniref:amino acid permease n=1 Tax=Candidatus Lariskella endosymbiont of Epinotia ramella TaxID=3066224 RepID=UPI0030D40276